MPKARGELRLCRAEPVNKAFQCKLAWKLLTNDSSLLVQSIKAKRLKTVEFLEYKKKATYFLVLNSFLEGKDLLRKGMTWKVGKGMRFS